MRRPLLFIPILLVVLLMMVLLERVLAHRESETRRESVRVRQLVSADVFVDRGVAAFKLDTGAGDSFLYLFDDGLWRCIQANAAPVMPSLINPVMGRLLETSGYVVSRDREAASSFGFNRQSTLRLSVCGPDVLEDPERDVVYAIEIGSSVSATDGSYVRPFGSDDIWLIDDDFRDVLEPDPDFPLPPMVDPRIIPEAWTAGHEGIRQITLERDGGVILHMQREDIPQPVEPLAPRWAWIITDGERQYEAHPNQIQSYGTFLLNVQFAGLPGPARRIELGVDSPRAAITLVGADGRRLQLRFGNQTPRGGIAVFSTFSGTLYEVPQPVIEMFFPDLQLLLDPAYGNPWQPWIGQ